MKNFLLLFFVIVMLGCSAGEISEIGLNTEKGENTARSLAENELSLLSDTDGTLWTKDSVVTELFPIYLEGKSLPSYYECKIETKGEDAGYILVNVDATDLPIVEASETGKTTTEIYREKYGTDISIIRYGLFYSTVIEGQPTAGRAVNRVLGTIGYEDEETIARLRSEILTKGVNPIYEKEELEEYANQLHIADKIRFTGNRKDVPALLSAMDIFVMTSLHEGLGIVLIEAMANGLYCLCENKAIVNEVTCIDKCIPISGNNISEWVLGQYSSYYYSNFYLAYSADIGTAGVNLAQNSFNVRPVLYLSSTVQITGGAGTSNDPYQLSL